MSNTESTTNERAGGYNTDDYTPTRRVSTRPRLRSRPRS